MRVGVVVLASVLVNPHLTVYDATVLVLPLLWIGGWIETSQGRALEWRPAYWSAVYWLFAAFLVPLAFLIKVQCSVFLMLWMFYHVSSLALIPRPAAALRVTSRR